MSHATSTFNMADVNVKQCDSFIATPTLKSNAGDRKVCKKKNLSWLFGADRKIRPRVTVWHHESLHLTPMKDSYSIMPSTKMVIEKTHPSK